MADQTDFKHITVNPAEPDDIVIHAGAPTEGSQPPMAAQESTRPAPAKSPSTSASAKAPSAYHATTLEDIQGFKMSKTQIAVIIVALAAIVAFVVWYTVFS